MCREYKLACLNWFCPVADPEVWNRGAGSGERAMPPPQKIVENVMQEPCILVQNFHLF